MRGIDFLKGIGQMEESLIGEAADPVRMKKKWNGNIIKFAGLAACIAVFVGAVCAGRAAGLYKQNNQKPMAEGSMDQQIIENTTHKIAEDNSVEEGSSDFTGQEDYALKLMVMIDDKLYVETGNESDIYGRCGMMDGSIDSTVDPSEIPTENHQSNFGTGYGFQYVDEDSIDVFIDGKWMRFDVPEDETQMSSGKMEMTVDTFTAGGGEFEITNTGSTEEYCGEDYRIDQLENDVWTECDKTGELVYKDIAWILKPGSSRDFTIDWSGVYGTLKAGKYRLVKTVYYESMPLEIYCEFEIG